MNARGMIIQMYESKNDEMNVNAKEDIRWTNDTVYLLRGLELL